MARIDILAKRLADQIDSVINQRLGQIENPVIRKAIEETLRDQVYENMGNSLSSKVDAVVDQSMKDIIDSIQGTGSKRKRGSASKISSDFGGKDDDSGSKSSNQNTPRRTPPTRDSGGKDSSFGGK